MQLVPCPNSFEINVNHRNNVLIVVMSIAAVLNLFSRPHTFVQDEWPRWFGKVVHASRQQPRGSLGRQCTHVGGGASAYGGGRN
jgi:hypothetical protein